MKKIFIIVFSVMLVAIVSVYFYWQNNKHKIVKDLIVNSVSNFTDSLYSLRYDSSKVDELTGEAYFENIKFDIDSTHLSQLKLANNLPDLLLEISIKSINAQGLDIALAVNDKKLVAKKIVLNEPSITIIHTGEITLKRDDTIALFRKILGDYSSIHAESIEIINATFVNKNSNKTINTQLYNLNISFRDIVVDSTKDYKNVVCYFVENMKANAQQLYITEPKRNSAIVFDSITFNSSEKSLSIRKIRSIREGKNEERFELNSIKLEDLNIKEFINDNSINVGNISGSNCMLTLYVNKKQASKSDISKFKTFDFPDDYFDKIKIGGISISQSTLLFKSNVETQNPPIRINGFGFHLSQNMKINERSTLRSMLDNAKWDMQANDFAMVSNNQKYEISFNGLKVDKALSSANIKSINVKAIKSKAELANESKYQQDIYDVEMKAIQLVGIDINKFINESSLQIQKLSLNLNLKVYHDRVPPEQPETKVGKYPHQLLLKIKLPIYISKAIINNSEASYIERSKETKQEGRVYFTKVEGELNNITNKPEMIQQNPICELKMSGHLLGKAKSNTQWRLFLNSSNGKFELNGQIGSMKFDDFNSLTKPLALTTTSGQLKSIKFSLAGNDNEAHGDLSLLYNDLNIESYKLDEETHALISKKGGSRINNFFVKNSNPSNGVTRDATFSVQRDIHKSFFNLIWKSAYDGIQNTILNKKIAELKKQMNEKK